MMYKVTTMVTMLVEAEDENEAIEKAFDDDWKRESRELIAVEECDDDTLE